MKAIAPLKPLLNSSPNERQVGGNHYSGEYQHWDFAPKLCLSWPEGCATKYLSRLFRKHKDDPDLVVQDMEKVLHYLEKLWSQVEQGIIQPFGESSSYGVWRASRVATLNEVWHRLNLSAKEMMKGEKESKKVNRLLETMRHYLNHEAMVSSGQDAFDSVGPNSDNYENLHKAEYDRWALSLSCGAPTQELYDQWLLVLRAMAGWSWHSTGVLGGLLSVRQEVHSLMESYAAYVQSEEGVDKEPTVVPLPVEFSGEETEDPASMDTDPAALQGYMKQHVDFEQPLETRILASEEDTSSPGQDLRETLKQNSRLSLSLLNQNQPLPIPIQVYLDLLEQYRRYSDPVPLSLEARLSSPNANTGMSSFQDYAEPTMKIGLGARTLDESLPNGQVTRSTIALWAVLDGVTCLQNWFLRMTDGPNPVVKDEELAHKIRLQMRVATSTLHQQFSQYSHKTGLDQLFYSFGETQNDGENQVPGSDKTV